MTVQQWQPEYINKCKIIGLGILVLGCEGKQMDCFTTDKFKYVPPKVPYGGGFGVENYTLEYIYREYTFHNNIWTKSNILQDLCRFLHCKLVFYRHSETDFVVAYSRQPPHDLNKWTYPGTHPHQLLLQKHHKIIFSRASIPNGKYKKVIHIKPPKQMLSKWFFTKPFSKYSLFLLQGAAVNFRYSYLSASNENMLVSLLSLNPQFFQNLDWAQNTGPNAYHPYPNIDLNLKYK